MSEKTIPTRSEIDAKYIWNHQSVFETSQEWEAELNAVSDALDKAASYRGRLSEGPQDLLQAMDLYQELFRRAGQVLVYAAISHEVDTTDQTAAKMYSQARSLIGKMMAAFSFINPELLAIGQETLQKWVQHEPQLAGFEHYFENLFRKQAHVRSAEVEEILGMLADPFAGPEMTNSTFVNGDFKFRPAENAQGEPVTVTSSTLSHLMASPDRTARRTAWESYTDTFLDFKNTLAGLLGISIKQNVFMMRARRHKSTLEASLFENNIPVDVFHNLIDVFKKNLPTWHRYWAIRKQALGVDQLHPYDIWAPIAKENPHLSYEEAVEWICQGLEPMGEAYVNTIRQGCLQDRWVDVLPNQGKTAGAFSYGWPGTYPFIVMSFDDSLFSLSTLAHELGHSMHSYLTWQTQPMIYSPYSLFVAEVASNFHQAMVRAHLLKTHDDPNFQIALIEEAMSNFHRYFFIMPTLARFELEIHQWAEQGRGLSADAMNELMTGLFEEGYGGEMVVDRPRTGITWATFAHLYTDYYVYQYATGISGAHALANRILSGEENAVQDYLGFLRAGSSLYPLDALKVAGVDLTRPEPVEQAFQTLEGLVDHLERLVG